MSSCPFAYGLSLWLSEGTALGVGAEDTEKSTITHCLLGLVKILRATQSSCYLVLQALPQKLHHIVGGSLPLTDLLSQEVYPFLELKFNYLRIISP